MSLLRQALGMTNPAQPPVHFAGPTCEELWGFKTVIAKTVLCRTSIYSYVTRGIFPRQRHLGPRRVAWLASR